MKRVLTGAVAVLVVGTAVLGGAPPETARQARAADFARYVPDSQTTGWSPLGGPTKSGGRKEKLTNDELAVASLDPLGLPIDASLISRINSIGGEQRTVFDPTATSNIQYLNRRGQPDVVGNGINITVGGPQPTTVLTQALFDKPLPVALHAEYRLDGGIVDPQVVVGASGKVAVSFTVTNIDVKQQKLEYQDSSGKEYRSTEPVFAPFVGTLTTTLPEEYEPTLTKDAVASTDEHGNTVLTWNLVLYPPLGNYQQTVGFEAITQSGVVPQTILAAAPVTSAQDPATGFSDEMLRKSVEGNVELTDGLRQLDEQTLALADGAAQLAAGLSELSGGMRQADTAVAEKLVPGSEGIAAGAGKIAAGQEGVTDAVGKAATGAQQLDAGAAALAGGLTQLSNGLGTLANTGLPEIESGLTKVRDGASKLADAVGSPTDPPIPTPTPTTTITALPTATPIPIPTPTPSPTLTPTLVQAITAAVAGTELLADEAETLATNLVPIVATIAASAVTSGTAATSAQDAATTAGALYAALCVPPSITPAQCADLLSAQTNAAAAATGAGTVATDLGTATVDATEEALRAIGIAIGSRVLLVLLEQIKQGILEVSVALRSGSYVPGQEGIVEALEKLVVGLDTAIAAAHALDAGAQASSLGADKLASGNAALAGGLDRTRTGARELSRATGELVVGATALAYGTAEVSAGLATLANGAEQSAAGSSELASGASALEKEGTRKILQSVIDSSAKPAMANAYLAAANKRAIDALPYGSPKGATGSAAYLLTMAPVTASSSGGWQLAAIVLLALSALAGALLKQSLATRREERAQDGNLSP